MRDPIPELLRAVPTITDGMPQTQLSLATELLDRLPHPLTAEEIEALLTVLPANGDPGHGLNWTILHSIEASPDWPIWDLLRDRSNEWINLLVLRLNNAEIYDPKERRF